MCADLRPVFPRPGRRRVRERRVDGRRAAAPGPRLVQQHEGCDDHREQIARGRARRRPHPRELHQPGARRNRADDRVHGLRGHPGQSPPLPRDDPARPLLDAAGHRERRALPGIRRSGIHHRRLPRSRRRTLHLVVPGRTIAPYCFARNRIGHHRARSGHYKDSGASDPGNRASAHPDRQETTWQHRRSRCRARPAHSRKQPTARCRGGSCRSCCCATWSRISIA
ncbi:hypothetical protein F01_260214 [Burkholderia cenocepacia]|nr:hypothetical protein F01_260214 [Burkholderia cenocepacia]